MEWAQQNAKNVILERVQKLAGKNAGMFHDTGSLKGVTYRDAKYSWDEKADEGVAKVIAEYVPKFAKGGVVNKATLGVIGEAGPEAVVPLSGIEKYSSGIISGLYEINSTLKKMLSQITKSSKKAFSSSISRGEAGSFDDDAVPVTNTVIDIGKSALSVGLGVAMAPALSRMLDSFKHSMTDLVKIVGSKSKNKMPVKEAASEGTGILGTLSSIGEGLFSMIPSFESNPADCCGAVTESADGLFGSLKTHLPKSIVDKSTSAFEGVESYSGKAFNGMSSYFSNSFAPLTKGFTRSMKEGEGIFKSLSRGIASQYMSVTKGKSVSDIAQGAFEQVKSSGVKAFNYINSNIPQSVKDNAAKAFGAIKDRGGKALSGVGSLFSSSFAPLTKGFNRSMEAGEGVFKSLSRGVSSQFMSLTKGKPISEIASSAFGSIKDRGSKAFSYIGSKVPQSIKDNATKVFSNISGYAGKAFSNIGSYTNKAFSNVGSFFTPLTKGFNRSMEAGEGVFKSLSRGVSSQFMSLTKGKPISEIASSAFGSIKDSGSKAFSFMKDNATKAFSFIGNSIPPSIKDYAGKAFSNIGSYANKAFSNVGSFFTPLTKGFTRSMEAGEGVFKSLSRGVSSQFMSLTKGKPISEIASSAFGSIKDYGKKGFSMLGGTLKGIGEKAKGGLATAGGAIKSLFPKKETASGLTTTSGAAMAPVENVKKVGDAGSSVKSNFENVKEALKNLAEGIKNFANKETFLGALNLIPTGVGLTAMVPGFLGAKLIEKMDGNKVADSLGGLATGLKSMASGTVLLGAGAILLSSIGLLGLLPALPGLAILGAISGLVTAGLTALSTGLTTFGTAAANPLMWLGIAAVAGLGLALIPLGYALSTLSPLVVSFGAVINSVMSGISSIITSVASGMTMFLGSVSIEKAAGLAAVAGGLVLLSGSMIAFSVATAAAGWVSFFGGGDGVLDKISTLAAAGPNLKIFADSVSFLTLGIQGFATTLEEIGSTEKNIDKLIAMANKLSGIAPVLSSLQALKIAIPSEQILTQTQMIEGNIDKTNATNLENIVPNSDVDVTKALPSTATPVSVSTISPSASVASVEQKMLQDRAAASPSKSEITSPELGNIVSENEEQTIILSEMRDLFEKFLTAIKPRSDVNSSGGGETGSTSSIPIAGKPANYYRRVTGNVSQTSGKGITNLGAKALS